MGVDLYCKSETAGRASAKEKYLVLEDRILGGSKGVAPREREINMG